MTHSQITLLIHSLEDVRRRTEVWVGNNLDDILPFINGFNLACRTLGIEGGYDAIYREVAKERGWEWTSGGVLPSMLEKGYGTTAIASELLTIEIEAWKRRGSNKSDSSER